MSTITYSEVSPIDYVAALEQSVNNGLIPCDAGGVILHLCHLLKDAWKEQTRIAGMEMATHIKLEQTTFRAANLQRDVERLMDGLEHLERAVLALREPSDEEWDEASDDPTGMVRHCEAKLLPVIRRLRNGKAAGKE